MLTKWKLDSHVACGSGLVAAGRPKDSRVADHGAHRPRCLLQPEDVRLMHRVWLAYVVRQTVEMCSGLFDSVPDTEELEK